MNNPSRILSIRIIGRRWFQRSYGNTYHSVEVYVTYEAGEFPTIRIPFEYGYGNQYEQTAHQALIDEGILPAQVRFASGTRQCLAQYCEEHGIDFSSECYDVERKRDL